jgi:hypothetical protein
LLIGIPATWVFGLKGAIWGSNLADVLSLVLVLVALRRKIGSDSEPSRSFAGLGGVDPRSLPTEISTK